MKMKLRFASLFAVLIASAPLLSASEVERLRALVAEQEMQIQRLELKVAQLTHLPTPTPTPASTLTPASEDGLVSIAKTCPEPATTEHPETYTVKAGDNIVIIARKHGTTSATLNKLNGLKSNDIIRPGQKLKLPAAPSTSLASTSLASTPPPAPALSPTTEYSSHSIEHKIAESETFYSISRKYGVSVNALIKENPSINPRALRIGQSILIPAKLEISDQSPVPGPGETSPLSNHSNIPISNPSSAPSTPRAADKPVKITQEISYNDFAKTYNTTTSRLDQLNGLRLDPTTILAQGSELYIPQQP